MRVLLIGALPRLWAPNHLPWLQYTTSALRRLGHQVATATYREPWTTSPKLIERTARFGGRRPLARFAAAMMARRDHRLVDHARRMRPELTIVLKGEVLSGAVLAEVKRFTDGPMVTWWVDDPWVYPKAVGQLPLFDRVFLFDRWYMQKLAGAGVTQTTFLPCACDETVYRPLALSRTDCRELATDVAFIASHYPGRGDLVSRLARQMDVGVWGKGWELPAAQRELDGVAAIRGGIVDDRKAAKIYNATKIGVNVHHPQSRHGGLNARAFDLLASGTFELLDYVPGMEELLEPGREVAVYRTPAEAADVAVAYLGDAAKRKTLVERGRARVLAEHTYVARMRTLEDVMFGSAGRTGARSS